MKTSHKFYLTKKVRDKLLILINEKYGGINRAAEKLEIFPNILENILTGKLEINNNLLRRFKNIGIEINKLDIGNKKHKPIMLSNPELLHKWIKYNFHSIRDFCSALGVSPSYVSQVLKGEKPIFSKMKTFFEKQNFQLNLIESYTEANKYKLSLPPQTLNTIQNYYNSNPHYSLDMDKLRKWIMDNYGKFSDFAKSINISPSYLSQILSKRKDFPQNLTLLLFSKGFKEFDFKDESSKIKYYQIVKRREEEKLKWSTLKSQNLYRKCGKCGEIKHISEFRKRETTCKLCQNKLAKLKYNTLEKRAYHLWYGAKNRGFKFQILSDDILEKLKGGKCEATGIQFEYSTSGRKFVDNPFAPSIDRIDNSKGYTRDNIQLVCAIFNIAKNKFSKEDFEKFIFSAYEFLMNQKAKSK